MDSRVCSRRIHVPCRSAWALRGSPQEVLARRNDHRGAAGSAGRSLCTGAAGCARITRRSCVAGCALTTCRAGISSGPLTSRCPCSSGCALPAGCSLAAGGSGGTGISGVAGVTRVSCWALRSGWPLASAQRERHQQCGNQVRIFHDNSFKLGYENHPRDCEQSPRFDQHLAKIISVGRSGHRNCGNGSAADWYGVPAQRITVSHEITLTSPSTLYATAHSPDFTGFIHVCAVSGAIIGVSAQPHLKKTAPKGRLAVSASSSFTLWVHPAR